MNEAIYWRQRYEMLMANFGDALKAAGLPSAPVILAEKESYEAGRIAGLAQRKPLTDEQLQEDSPWKWGWYLDSFKAGVRYAEAAHGITGEQK